MVNSNSTNFLNLEQVGSSDEPEYLRPRGTWSELNRPFPELKAEAEGRRTSWYEQPASTKSVQTQTVKAKVGISIDLPQFGIVDPAIRDILRLQEDKTRIYREATAVLKDIDMIKRSFPWL